MPGYCHCNLLLFFHQWFTLISVLWMPSWCYHGLSRTIDLLHSFTCSRQKAERQSKDQLWTVHMYRVHFTGAPLRHTTLSYAKDLKDSHAVAAALTMRESRGSQIAAASLSGADATSAAHLLPSVSKPSLQGLPHVHTHTCTSSWVSLFAPFFLLFRP